MATPRSKREFAEFCLRQLGKGAHNVEVTDEQIDDAIDLALQWYLDYNAEATEKMYYKHQITADDVANKWIPMPENIMGVVNIFPIGDAISSSDSMFNIRYQIALNDLYTLTSSSLVPYFMTMQHLRLIEELLVGKALYRYSKHLDRCYIDIDWTKVTTGSYLVLECYQVIDPALFPDVWNDRWLIKYATALIKKQWGTNIAYKYADGMVLPSGKTFNPKIYDDAVAEIAAMEAEMIRGYSMPPMDMIG